MIREEKKIIEISTNIFFSIVTNMVTADFPSNFPYSTSLSASAVESVCLPSALQHPKAHQADSSLQPIRFASSLNDQGATLAISVHEGAVSLQAESC